MSIILNMNILSMPVILFIVHILLLAVSAVGLPYALIKRNEKWSEVFAILLPLEFMAVMAAANSGALALQF